MMEIPLITGSSERMVLVVGAAGMDMVGLVTDPLQLGDSGPAKIRASFGGVGRNVAENLARLGQPVNFITAVGQDRAGQQLLLHLTSTGVQVNHCLQSDRYNTGSYLAIYGPDATKYVALDDMAILSELTPTFLRQNKSHVAEASMLFVDANLPPASLKSLLKMAVRARVPVCADATTSLLAVRLLPYLENIQVLTANSTEASVLCQGAITVHDQATALQAARHLVNRGVELAVVSLAEFGVVYATSETNGHVPAIRTRVLDPTGAGDALTATIIFGLLNDIPIDESVHLGVTAASLILRFRGTVLPEISLEKLYDELVM